MDIILPNSGVFVVAVSGGVDSMALLHMLQNKKQTADQPYIVIVAHLDHGIRPDSGEDRKLVQEVAAAYGVPFVYDEITLGEGASERQAREARYKFLHKVKQNSSADAIITAHHGDDMLETAIINIARGTGRKGLTSLKSNDVIIRPLLRLSKEDLHNYAKANGLKWREDTTNHDTKYQRNYIRHNVLNKVDQKTKNELRKLIDSTSITNDQIDEILQSMLDQHLNNNKLNRHWLISLPHTVGLEIIAAWLRQNDYRDFDKKTLERLLVSAKVSKVGNKIEVIKKAKMLVHKDSLELVK